MKSLNYLRKTWKIYIHIYILKGRNARKNGFDTFLTAWAQVGFFSRTEEKSYQDFYNWSIRVKGNSTAVNILTYEMNFKYLYQTNLMQSTTKILLQLFPNTSAEGSHNGNWGAAWRVLGSTSSAVPAFLGYICMNKHLTTILLLD